MYHARLHLYCCLDQKPAYALRISDWSSDVCSSHLIYGSYAPGGDCSREPRVTINSTGMTFRASGRDVKTTRLEYAASIFGVRYEGITLAFYPFVKSDNNLGPVLVYVNDEEKPGAIRIDRKRVV